MVKQMFTAADSMGALVESGAFLPFGEKLAKKSGNTLAFCSFSAILKANGCGNPAIAAVAPHRGGSLNIFDDFFESVGRTLCGVSIATFTTPAGSFFVSGVVTGGKSLKLSNRRLKCVHAPTTDTPSANSPSTTDVTTIPHVFPVRWRPG